MSCPYLIKKNDFSYSCHYSFKKLSVFKALFFCSTNLCLHNCEASALAETSQKKGNKEKKERHITKTETAVL